MSITELLDRVGVNNLKVQFLHDSLTDIQNTKHGSRVTFMTREITPAGLLSNEHDVAAIVWIKREDWQRVCKEVEQ